MVAKSWPHSHRYSAIAPFFDAHGDIFKATTKLGAHGDGHTIVTSFQEWGRLLTVTRGMVFATGSEPPKPPSDDWNCAGWLLPGATSSHWPALLELSERLLLIGIVRAKPKFGWWMACWKTRWFNAV